jgi:hypothetical protein
LLFSPIFKEFFMPDRITSTPGQRREYIAELRRLPALLREATEGLDDTRLDTPYREGGWTVRQVVHHVADSHLNAFTRLKLVLTEEYPTLRPYDQDKWAELPDTLTLPVEISLRLLEALHERMATVVETAADEDWSRLAYHPENGDMSFDDLARTYAWHGRHHAEQITGLRSRMGWRTSMSEL